MAKELTVNLTLGFSKGNINTSMSSGTLQFTVTGSDYIRETWTVPTSTTLIPLGSITTPGYAMMINKDATNYVDIYDGVSGNACIRLKPGEAQVFRFKTTAPAAKANSATVKVDFLIVAD